jgi:hypothetical protein
LLALYRRPLLIRRSRFILIRGGRFAFISSNFVIIIRRLI